MFVSPHRRLVQERLTFHRPTVEAKLAGHVDPVVHLNLRLCGVPAPLQEEALNFIQFQYRPFLEPRATGDVAFAQIGSKLSPPLSSLH